LWEELLCDRRPLLAALDDMPQTLIHGDPDERHIGLRWTGPDNHPCKGTDGSAELILIDWEVIGRGLGAFDVNHLMANVPRLCDPSQPCPDYCLSDELPNYYFDRYLAAGGMGLIQESWPRVYELAGVVASMESLPMGAGRRIRVLQGLAPVRRAEGVSEETLMARARAAWDRTERNIERVTRAVRTWLA
jgi:hypothetical protein